MNEYIYCNNCGKTGHIYQQCKLPITSCGIITFKILPNRTLQYLLIRRKDTLGYVDFIRGKYNIHNYKYIINMLNEMTIEERNNLQKHDFEYLWSKLWGNMGKTNNSQILEKNTSFEKIQKLKTGIIVNNNRYTLDSLIGYCTSSWTEPEWGFPKGRRHRNETDHDCAIREWEEETGLSRSTIKMIKNVTPYEEIFTGSNHKSYKHKYYIAKYDTNYDSPANFHNFEKTEVGKMEWLTINNAILSIRPYDRERKHILTFVNNLLYNYIL